MPLTIRTLSAHTSRDLYHVIILCVLTKPYTHVVTPLVLVRPLVTMQLRQSLHHYDPVTLAQVGLLGYMQGSGGSACHLLSPGRFAGVNNRTLAFCVEDGVALCTHAGKFISYSGYIS